ncbi:hypothetical protein ISF_06169 [Cordyceps fumosorosea ARSEF 2679]|uniref:Uncharacterized protein n=1 Tax=Cordyceps fumosorosea (strain ARSEF 2679) TaxID=1081104 RepID=A0A167T1Q7_CORFA|nr:hypothetical protein ISF_06169 [Cordyceps fumosorosea ARSEF 2679]OAA60159.1 hypothetical protein ISF_06169 [Cordyceps fumosorosea ARSEF 2679]
MAVTAPRAAAVVPGACCVQLLGGATRRASTLPAKPLRYQSDGSSSSSSSRPPRSGRPAKTSALPPRAAPVARILSPDVAKFIRSRDGHLTTTPETARFLRAHPTIDHDHGTMARLEAAAHTPADAAAAIRRLSQQYGVRLAWSPRHVIHPHRLRFLDPRGHPLAARVWAFATATGGVSAVVWQLTKRELLRAVFRRLAARGYDEHGGRADGGGEIRGTLWLTLWRPQHARRLPVDEFGEVVADVLDRHYAVRPASAEGRGGSAEGPTDEMKNWKPRERSGVREGDMRRPAGEADGQSTWQPRKSK